VWYCVVQYRGRLLPSSGQKRHHLLMCTPVKTSNVTGGHSDTQHSSSHSWHIKSVGYEWLTWLTPGSRVLLESYQLLSQRTISQFPLQYCPPPCSPTTSLLHHIHHVPHHFHPHWSLRSLVCVQTQMDLPVQFTNNQQVCWDWIWQTYINLHFIIPNF